MTDVEDTIGSIADYQLIESLGAANNGEFYLAIAPPRLHLDAERVMVKVLDGHVPEDTFRRATRELRAFASVKSPWLVTLRDAGQEGRRLFYSMDYLPLGSLARPARPLDRGSSIRAVADAARAAHALHEHGLAHRDIQPVNVLLTETGGQLADLGLAQVLAPDSSVTGLGDVSGVEYMDPDVLAGGAPSRAADIWSIGTTLHRALTGSGLYGVLPENEPLLAIRRVYSTKPSLSSEIDSDARAIVERCIESDPARRYPTALEIAEALDAIEPPIS